MKDEKKEIVTFIDFSVDALYSPYGFCGANHEERFCTIDRV